ncbi:MAG: [Alistipes sp.]|nr:[FeFe] hydrogenase H-cluster radical SAM maturase HydG [Alistipes sp.]
VPRIRPADDIDLSKFPNAVTDDLFKRIVAILRIAVPYTGMIISTRESTESRKEVLDVGVSQISGGSKTTVGGYALSTESEGSEQFDISDHRTLDQIVGWLLSLGYLPSFCTACYREGRTGDRFMSLAKAGTIGNCCAPNALMTLMEYLCDYASDSTKAAAQNIISQELAKIPSERVREITTNRIAQIINGERDFRF